MTIEITHYAANRDFYVQDDMGEAEYREYVTAYADAVRKAVQADYPEATVESEIDWQEASMKSLVAGLRPLRRGEPRTEDEQSDWYDLNDRIGEEVDAIAERIWGAQEFEPSA